MASTDEEVQEDLEDDVVFGWRRDQLVAAGLTVWDAGRLCLAGADHHDVISALAHGATVDQVLRIYL